MASRKLQPAIRQGPQEQPSLNCVVDMYPRHQTLGKGNRLEGGQFIWLLFRASPRRTTASSISRIGSCFR